MKIAFLMNHFDTTDISKYPRHIGYYITTYLKKYGAEIEMIPPAIPKYIELYYKIKQAYYHYLCKKRHLRYSEIGLIKKEAKIRSKILKKSNADFVFSFGPVASAFLDTDKKIAFWADATSKGIENYYPEFSNLTASSVKNMDKIEAIGFKRASAAFYSSSWAKQTAIDFYGADKEKIFVVPLGANFDIENSEDYILKIIKNRLTSDEIKFLFIGYAWERKGGHIAVEIVKKINQNGQKAKLIVIGCNPKIDKDAENYVESLGKLDKKNDAKLFYSHLEQSHFYLMPTRAESFGHSFCEANAFGVPAISYRTGGVTDVIKDGINGQLFDLDAKTEDFSNYLINTFKNKEKYLQLCLDSFKEYKTRLNWDYGAQTIIKTLNNF